MMASATNLKQKTFQASAWIFVFPFLAAWPFVSALPLFSLINNPVVGLSTSLDVIFLLTGFWAAAGAFAMFWWLLRDDVRMQRLTNRADKGLLIGSYASLWTTLYIIAALANR
jgi:hypothetical protein